MSLKKFFCDENLMKRLQLTYNEHKFAIEVRYHLSAWLESIAWRDLQAENAQEIYDGLLDRLKLKKEDSSLDELARMRLRAELINIMEIFKRPEDLLETLKTCFSMEQVLIASQNSDAEASSEVDKELLKYQELEIKFREAVGRIKEDSQEFKLKVDNFHTIMQRDLPALKGNIENLQDATITKTKKESEQMRLIINQIWTNIQQQKENILSGLQKGCTNLKALLQDHTWALISYYKNQQKLHVCYQPMPPKDAVDTLNKVCEESSIQLKAYLHYADKISIDVELLPRKEEDLVRIQKVNELLKCLLSLHLTQIFVITKQPLNVQKIVKNKSPNLSMCVHLLGGRGLGIEHALPRVSINVYAEPILEAAMQADSPTKDGVCRSIDNGKDVIMELKSPTGHIQANLDSVTLCNVERLEKKVKDDRVTEYKYGMVFYTKVNVCNQIYNLKTLSLPIVLTSQTSQSGAATGTLIWDAAFSKPERHMYEEDGQTPWSKMEEVLTAMFNKTGRTLDKDQINYIARSMFKTAPGQAEDFSSFELTKERFLRDKIPGKEFTYWRWIYACYNLIERTLTREWKDELIYGFISKDEAETLLEKHKAGTFLVRFRENKLEDSQRAFKSACLAVAYVTRNNTVEHVKNHLTPKDLHNKSLTHVLNSLVDVHSKEDLMVTLYPNRDFSELCKSYRSGSDEGSEGYNNTQLMIGVKSNRSEADDSLSMYEGTMSPSDSSAAALSPGSSATPMSPCSGPLSPDLADIQVDDLLQNFGFGGLLSFSSDIMLSQTMVRIDPVVPITVVELENS